MLLDTNVLVYATFAGAPEHERARGWLERRLAQSPGSVVLCWPAVYAFVRLIASPRVFGEHAIAVGAAWAVASAYVEHPATRMVAAGSRHAAIAAELARTPGLRSDDVPDVEIAALAIEHGLALASHDHGFRRFAAVRFVDPLAGQPSRSSTISCAITPGGGRSSASSSDSSRSQAMSRLTLSRASSSS